MYGLENIKKYIYDTVKIIEPLVWWYIEKIKDRDKTADKK